MKIFSVATIAPLLMGSSNSGTKTHTSIKKYPQVVSVTTTREHATNYLSHLDILRGQSKRLIKGRQNENYILVQLNVMLYGEQEVVLLEELEKRRIVALEKIRQNQNRRKIQGISQDLACYRTIDEVYATVDRLVQQYPNFATSEDFGESWKMKQGESDGYPLKVIVVSAPSKVEKVNMMILGGHHSRELPPPEMLLRWVEMLLENYSFDADITWILERTNIHVVLISNPDGRAYVQQHLDWYYRKNAHIYGCDEGISSDGVDLNRNWPMFWGRDIGSSSDFCDSSFRGGAPLSEPETSSLYNYFKSIFPRNVSKGTVKNATEKLNEKCPVNTPGLFIDVHSSGNFIYFPWGISDTLSPNHLSLLTMAAKLAKPGDYTLWGPGQNGFLYFVSGDATDTTYGIDCIPSFGYEIGTNMYEPCDLFERHTVPVVHKSLLYAAKTASAPYKIPLGPDVLSINGTVDDIEPERLVLTVEISDVHGIVDHAVFPSEKEKSQIIKEVRVYVDVHPYDGGESIVMTPADGSFNAYTEVATVVLNTTGWAAGRHTVYVEGVDSDGNAGAISAVFVDKNSTLTSIEHPGVSSEVGSEDTVEDTMTSGVRLNNSLSFVVTSCIVGLFSSRKRY